MLVHISYVGTIYYYARGQKSLKHGVVVQAPHRVYAVIQKKDHLYN